MSIHKELLLAFFSYNKFNSEIRHILDVVFQKIKVRPSNEKINFTIKLFKIHFQIFEKKYFMEKRNQWFFHDT